VSLKILLVDDDFGEFAHMFPGDGAFAALHFIILKHCHYFDPEDYANLKKSIAEKSGELFSDVAMDGITALNFISKNKYDILFLDGGFDFVLDGLSNLPINQLPTYISTISGSIDRNVNMRKKIEVLPGTELLSLDAKFNFGIERI